MKVKVNMEDLILDDSLIDSFREEVNSNDQFKGILSNIEDKNKLNVVYSAMDWINVAVEGTKNLDIEVGGFGYNHQNTVKLMQYIMLVDLIFESIRQIYRSLEKFETNYPYSNSNSIFNKEDLSDDDYFKHLRAIFGMHPVNLNSIDGVKEKNKKYFASWVAPGLVHGYDFIVEIYGNSVENDDSNFVGINLFELNQYVRERYLLLEDLIKVPKAMTSERYRKYKNKEINLDADMASNIQILITENKKRFGSFKGYESLLNYIFLMLKVDFEKYSLTFDKDLIKKYLEELERKIPRIKTNLEAMEFEQIEIGIRARGYEFEKIIQFLRTQDHEIGEEYFFGMVEYGELPLEFLKLKDFYLYRLVFDAYLFSKMNGKDYLTFKELIKTDAYIEKGALGFTGYRI